MAGGAGSLSGSSLADSFTPYVPRLALTWPEGVAHRRLPGSLLFADVSGFTRLSERLAGRGRIGAEEITDAINEVFGALIEAASAYGGDVLKFGGDALMVLFDGDDYARRAILAAASMQRTIGRAGRLNTSAGAVVLRMSVGVASGQVDAFLVGATHRELVVVGPTATRAGRLETAAAAGQVLIDEASAGAVASSWCDVRPGGGALRLRAVRGPGGELAAQPPATAAAAASLVPESLRDELLAGVESEHRVAAVAFVRFAGTDEPLTTGDAGLVGERLEALVTRAAAACSAHGTTFLATDVAADGGKLILAGGMPRARGDDDDRLLHTVREVLGADCGLALAAGLNAGPLFSAAVGSDARRTYTVMGDVVNLSARLAARAGDGELVAPATVLERTRTSFETRALEPFTVKGRRAPVRAVLVGAPSAGAPTMQRSGLLLGRDREVAVARNVLADVRSGQGRALELVGEAGIGKSRLGWAIAEEAPDLTLLEVRCSMLLAETPYGALRPALLPLVGALAGEAPGAIGRRLAGLVHTTAPRLTPWLPLLAIPIGADVESTTEVDALLPAFRQQRVHDVLREFLTTLLQGPGLVLAEDVHWADEATLAWLDHLCASLAKTPWLVCVLRRPDGPPVVGGRGHTIELGPLDDRAIDALAIAAAGEFALADASLRAVRERAGGNPLFASELAATVASLGTADDLPPTVEAIAAQRIDALARDDRELVRMAAVLGRRFELDLLGAIAPDVPVDDPDRWRPVRDVVEWDSARLLRFVHDVYRDAAYGSLPYRRRRALHALAAAALQRRPADAGALDSVISYHCFRAEDWAGAWRHARAAADAAREAYATSDAAELYERALDAGRRTASVARIELARAAEALGDLCELSGRYEHAAKAFRTASALLPGAPAEQAPLLRKRGELEERSGRYPQALRWYGRGLRALEGIAERTDAARAALEVSYAGVRYRQGRPGDCARWARRAAASAQAAGDERTLATAYYLLDAALTDLDDPEARRYRDLSLPIFVRIGDLVGLGKTLNNQGIDAYYAGDWDEALVHYRRGQEVATRSGDVVSAATLANNEAEILAERGELDRAEELLQQASRAMRAAGYEVGIALATSNLGRVALRRGDAEGARKLLNEALERFTAIGAAGFVVETRARIAECEVFAGHSEGGWAEAGACLAAAEDPAFGATRALLERVRGLARLQQGQLDDARAHFEASLRQARDASALYEEALTLDALALVAQRVGDSDVAAAKASASIRQWLGIVRLPEIPV